jgi:hypothetical protein
MFGIKKPALILLVVFVLLATVAGAQTYGIKVYVDGNSVSFPDQRPFIDKNNRTLVPIRFIAEEMGAEVGWDGKTELVTIEKEGVLINLTIGEQRAQVNGAWKNFDTNATLVNGRTMVPLRFISETLGADVDWDKDTRTVYIWTGAVPKEPVKPEQPGITPFEGAKPTKVQDWIVSGKPASKRWDNPVIKYITMADLPAELDSIKIMNIDIDDKFINVLFVNTSGYKSIPDLFLAEGNDITRIRNMDNFSAIDDTAYLQKYTVKGTFDTHPDLGNLPTEADITKITHFIFDGYGENLKTRLLAVENPYYGGAK